jgi:hypothetical protein
MVRRHVIVERIAKNVTTGIKLVEFLDNMDHGDFTVVIVKPDVYGEERFVQCVKKYSTSVQIPVNGIGLRLILTRRRINVLVVVKF